MTTDELIERLLDASVCSPAQNWCRNNTSMQAAATRLGEQQERIVELEYQVEKHENNNQYNALLQLGMLQLLRENGVRHNSRAIIDAHTRHDKLAELCEQMAEVIGQALNGDDGWSENAGDALSAHEQLKKGQAQ